MTAELAKLLAATPAPIYLLDQRRRIVYCNPACSAWIELPAEEILGRPCVYASSADAVAEPIAARLAGLCPPPEVFAGVRTVAMICSTGEDGRLLRRRAEFIPLTDDGESSTSILAIAEPNDLPSDAAGSPMPSHDGQALHPNEPFDESLILHQQLQQLHHELRSLRQMDRLVGNSPAMVRVRAQVQLAAAGAATVLVVGPAGSGRQHVAKAVHYARRDADANSLVPLSCSLLGTELLRSTLSVLLGRSAGRRSGTDRSSNDRPAVGTLLLGEVHELPVEVQAELAGYLKSAALPLRIISTSVAPLDEMAAAERFHAGLACALSTVVIRLPPLAERREDIPLLAQALVEELNARGQKQLSGFSPEALDQLAAYAWPGNIDELAAAIRHAHADAEGTQIMPADLPHRLHLAAAAGRHSRRGPQPIDLEEFLGDVERQLISRAMRLAKGNKAKAARLLGLTRPRLYRRMVQLRLEEATAESAAGDNGDASTMNHEPKAAEE